MPDAIVQPRPGRGTPSVGPLAVLAATGPDLALLRSGFACGADKGRRLFTSRLYSHLEHSPGICLAGPMVGAPYAVMVAETLIAWGARRLVLLGWCGAVTETVAIGDLVLPTSALIDEGTSRHYLPDAIVSMASPRLAQDISEACGAEGIGFHAGPIWTTDAPFRETPEKVIEFRRRGALAVEMEASALFTLAAYRGVEVAALLVVSDDLSSLTWRPGFKDPRFARGREAACRVIRRLGPGPSLTPSRV
jgi:nucleoside phosphorylase